MLYANKYVATFEYNFHGTYTQEIEYYSGHRANSRPNFEDAMSAIRRTFERGISENAHVLSSYRVTA